MTRRRMRKPVIQIKSDTEIGKMRDAGLIVAATLAALRDAIEPGLTAADLDAIAERCIRDAGAVPSFKGYRGFPATICVSVNDEIVHGIPDTNKKLRDGDVVSIDCGAIIDGWHGDAAITVPVGTMAPELRRLLEVCEEALWRGLAQVVPGGRLTDIGHAVESYVRAHGGYGIVREYVGHGIGSEMHQDPQVPNYGRPGRGPALQRGVVLAVEPMVNLGTQHTKLLDDGWTVVTRDGMPSAHFEHTVTPTEEGPWVLTSPDGGRSRFAELLGAGVKGDAS
ncbi:MAG: type I methionyl aminopeptidase [Streptosporangiales bacterium]|nr:type I methionyl aminopeptidase [Streptosporangiales bacterium]